MDIKKLKSPHPLTPYAPSYDISVGTTVWEEVDKTNKISEFLMSKEEEILQLPQDDKVGIPESVSLGEGDVTTRYGQYNLFDYIDQCPELNDLLRFYQLSYLEFMRYEYLQPRNLTVICWYNIIRKGQAIGMHRHGTNHHAYLSGNMQFTDCKSSTFYQFPFENAGIDIDVKKGQLSYFPSYVLHGVKEYQDEVPRISVAFDLHCSEFRGSYPGLNQREFMNEEIYKQLTS